MCLFLSYKVCFERSKKISLSHGKDVKMFQQMGKYVNNLMLDPQQFGIINTLREGTNNHCYDCCFVFFVLLCFGLTWRR